MSNMHGKFRFDNFNFFYTDNGSTNGSWLKLSNENRQMQRKKLHSQSIFRIGNSVIYQLQLDVIKPKIAP